MNRPTLTSDEYRIIIGALLLAKHADPVLLGVIGIPSDNSDLLDKLAQLRGLAMFDELHPATPGTGSASISPSGECRAE